MKSLFLTLLLLNAVAAAVDRPSGFAGIPWGASPEEAKRALQARPGVKFPEDSDDYHVEVTGGIFAGQQVTKWVLEFPERKLRLAGDGEEAHDQRQPNPAPPRPAFARDDCDVEIYADDEGEEQDRHFRRTGRPRRQTG